MSDSPAEGLEKIRQQFNLGPYPRVPIDRFPKDDVNGLFIHNLVTPFYLRNQNVITTEDTVILDAGCGSGYKSLLLAAANPGATIVGIDLSETSVELAQQRLAYHGFTNTEFHVLLIEDLPSLGLKFDYINCDEVLYLLPDPLAGLRSLQSVLKPHGIIRANLHSAFQRTHMYRAQRLFQLMGLMDDTPGETEVQTAIATFTALKDPVDLKQKTFVALTETGKLEEAIVTNYLLQGDKGYTIPELFTWLQTSGLEFIGMVAWRYWELLDLFQDPDDLPVFLAMSLPELTIAQRLHLFELLHPVNRLLDFWCGHVGQAQLFQPVNQWQPADWQRATVHLHPQLRSPQTKALLLECLTDHTPFEISRHLTLPTAKSILIDSTIAACLLPLWNAPQPFTALVDRWLKTHPLDPATLTPLTPETAAHDLQTLLRRLEVFLYILVEKAEGGGRKAER